MKTKKKIEEPIEKLTVLVQVAGEVFEVLLIPNQKLLVLGLLKQFDEGKIHISDPVVGIEHL